jgi:hypothetical protein
MMKKVSFYLLGYLFTLMMFSSCNYDYIYPEPVVIPKDSIKFSTQIEPIFNNGNNCTSCHGGSQVPDLRTGKAYNSINNATFINLTAPETSLIYHHPSPENTSDHAWKKYTAEQEAYVLKWIKEGAKNN